MKRLSALTGGKSVVNACVNLKTAALHYMQHQRGPLNIGVCVVQFFLFHCPALMSRTVRKKGRWYVGEREMVKLSSILPELYVQECGRSVQQCPMF